MSDLGVFLTGVGITAAVSVLVVAYVRSHLKAILVDLCGTTDRANFWAAFSHVSLVLVPLIFAMQYRGEFGRGSSLVFELGAQLKWALVGLVTTLVTQGIVISSFIPRRRPGSEGRPPT